jgi:protoporphyrinogen oxidase
MSAARIPIVVLGAGPAGLGAAWRLARRGVFDVSVIERGSAVGGNAGSFEFAGMPVDYGSHRLHTSCSPEILDDIRQMLGWATNCSTGRAMAASVSADDGCISR